MTGATTGSGGPSTGASPDPIGNYTFNLGETTITWTATNLSGTATCFHTVTVYDDQPATFSADPFEDCVEKLVHAIYTGNEDELDYDVDYPNADYKILHIGDTNLDIDLSTYSDNCCTTADENLLSWTIDFDGPEPSVSGTGQPSDYQYMGNPAEIYLWGDGVTFQPRVHTITYWITDCNGIKSDPVQTTITINPRPEIAKQ